MDQEKKFYHVSKKLLPVKLHFFLLFAGYGGVKPFHSLIGKGLNISATAVGLTNTVLMGLTLLCKPLIGSKVDYFRNLKSFLIFLVLLNAVTTLGLLLLPPIQVRTPEPINVRFQVTNSPQTVLIPLPGSFSHKCIKEIAGDSEVNCYIVQKGTENAHGIRLEESQDTNLHSLSSNENVTFPIHLHSKEFETANLTNLNHFHFTHLKCEPDIHLCRIQVDTAAKEYETFQFWAFACIIVVAGLATGSTDSLSDVACYEVLGEQRHLYGRQRMYGTIGLSLSCLLSGYLSDLATGDNPRKDFSPGIYLMLCLLLADSLVLYKLPLNNELKASTSIFRDVRKVFHSGSIVLFAVGSVLIGCFFASISYYELWYLQDLGASQSLMGWTIIMECLAAEMPFFFVSGWFVKKLGSFNCLVGSFAAYALRFGCYSMISDPRWALLIATTHGFTYAIFQAAMTNFVSLNAPKGVEGTMFGIFGGLIDGMGQTTGSLLCGVAFDNLGGRLTYTIASILSGACAVAFLILSRLLQRFANRTRENIAESNPLKKENQ